MQKIQNGTQNLHDQTGKFPYISSRGDQDIIAMYDFDSNEIVIEVMKSRQG